MSSLREQLLKAKLITKEDAQKVERDKRKERKQMGARGLLTEKEKEQQRLEQQRAEQAVRDREREQQRQQTLKQREVAAQVRELILRHAVTQNIRGPRRFYYVNLDRRLPCMMISNQAADRLEQGELAIIELRDGSRLLTSIVPRDIALKLIELAPEAVVFFNRD